MAGTTTAENYGAEIQNGITYKAQFEGAATNARCYYTGDTHTANGKTGPLFNLDADSSGSISGESDPITLEGYDAVVFISTSRGVVMEQEPL